MKGILDKLIEAETLFAQSAIADLRRHQERNHALYGKLIEDAERFTATFVNDLKQAMAEWRNASIDSTNLLIAEHQLRITELTGPSPVSSPGEEKPAAATSTASAAAGESGEETPPHPIPPFQPLAEDEGRS